MFNYFLNCFDRAKKFRAIPKPARIHSPDPFLRAGNAVSVLRKTISPENSFRKTKSTELALEFRQFLLWRNPHSPATTIPKKQNLNRRQTKQNAWWRGESGHRTAEAERHCFRSVSERMLGCDGIRRGAYRLVWLHHALRACHIICFESRCELGTIQTPKRNSKVFSVDTSGRRKAPTKDFLAGLQENSEFLARKRALFSRQEAGASQRFLWRRPF